MLASTLTEPKALTARTNRWRTVASRGSTDGSIATSHRQALAPAQERSIRREDTQRVSQRSSAERQQSRQGFRGRECKQRAQNTPEGELSRHPFPISFLCIMRVVVHSFSFYHCRRCDAVLVRDALGLAFEWAIVAFRGFERSGSSLST